MPHSWVWYASACKSRKSIVGMCVWPFNDKTKAFISVPKCINVVNLVKIRPDIFNSYHVNNVQSACNAQLHTCKPAQTWCINSQWTNCLRTHYMEQRCNNRSLASNSKWLQCSEADGCRNSFLLSNNIKNCDTVTKNLRKMTVLTANFF